MASAARTVRPSVRREEILQGALRCFNAVGYERTTIRDICEESGASIGSVYHLFDEKQSIAGALYHDGVKGWTERVADAVRAAPTTEAAIHAAVEAYLDWSAEHPQWTFFLAASRGLANRSIVRRDVDVLMRRLDKVLQALFSKAAAAGEVVELPPDLYWPLMLGPTYATMLFRVRRHGPSDPPEAWLPTREERHGLAAAAWRSMRR